MTLKYDKSKTWAFDIETFAAVFSAGFENMETGEYKKFSISRFKDQGQELFDFLCFLKNNTEYTISFNGQFFDVPVLHKFIDLWLKNETFDIVYTMYQHAQWVIQEAGRWHRVREPLWTDIDLYKINHYDNRAKTASLKKIQVFLKMDTIEELPHDIHDPDLGETEINEIIAYMDHDIEATKLFAEWCDTDIEFRFELVDEFGIEVLNYSDAKIGSEYMLKELIKEMGHDRIYKYENGKKQPFQSIYPEGFKVHKLLFPYLKFERPETKALVNWLESLTLHDTIGMFSDLTLKDVGSLSQYINHEITDTEYRKCETRKAYDSGELSGPDQEFDNKGYPILSKDDNRFKGMQTYIKKYIDHLNGDYEKNWSHLKTEETFKLPTKIKKININFGGLTHYWGTGGLHASIEPGIYKSDDEHVIIDADVTSFYPSLSIENSLAPKHYDTESWVSSYGGLRKKRLQYDKKHRLSVLLKLALNATYGNSGNVYSPIYDPAFTVSTCLNGQLTLTMLMEMWLQIPGLKLLTANTDGANALIPRKHLDWFYQICKQFEEQTSLSLEFAEYETMFHRDVNNYLYVVKGKDQPKRKGIYEYNVKPHQKTSQLVVAKAVEAYWLKQMPIEQFITNHDDMFDFMLATKIPRSSKLYTRNVYNIDKTKKFPGWSKIPNISNVQPDTTEPYWDGQTVQNNVSRYIVSKNETDPMLVKIMPPLPDKDEPREMSIAAGHHVKMCSNIKDFDWKAIDYQYYIDEAYKLTNIVGQIDTDNEENDNDGY